jgi:hypothetical protein
MTARAPSAVPHRWSGNRRAINGSGGQSGGTVASGGIHGPPRDGYHYAQNAPALHDSPSV